MIAARSVDERVSTVVDVSVDVPVNQSRCRSGCVTVSTAETSTKKDLLVSEASVDGSVGEGTKTGKRRMKLRVSAERGCSRKRVSADTRPRWIGAGGEHGDRARQRKGRGMGGKK